MDIIDQLKLMEAGKVGPFPRDETLRAARETIERLRAIIKQVVDDCGSGHWVSEATKFACTHEQCADKER